MTITKRRSAQLSVVAVAALAIFTVAAVMLLAGGFTTGTAQAQPDPNLNTGKYKDPQPCGINVNDVPKNPDGEFSGGHVALFDAYWDYNTQTLNNNLCPPLAEHTIVRNAAKKITGIVTGRTASNIDINETVFHAGNEFNYVITAADRQKYPFLPPAGTKVWWLKQDDPIAEAQAGDDDDDPELVLGISAGLFKKEDWFRQVTNEHGVKTEVAPLQYEFEAERDPEGNVLPFLVFKNGEEFPIWDSRKIDTASIPIKPGEYDHYNWMFFPEADQSHTYILEVHVKGHVRTEPEAGTTPDKWQPLTWPTGKNATAYTPDEPTDAFTKTLDSIQTVVSSEVRKEKYTIHVGPLHLNEQPEFGAMGVVTAGAAAGTTVGEPIPMYGTDRDRLDFTPDGVGSENFTVKQTEGMYAGVNAQLVVKDGATLSYPGKDPAKPKQAYYDLRLNVSDRHDREDGQDTAIDDTIPMRIFVVPSSGPWITVSFDKESSRVGETVNGYAQVKGLPAGATVSTIIAYHDAVDRRDGFAARFDTNPRNYRFTIDREQPGTQRIIVAAEYTLSGETQVRTVASGLYPITWLR